MEAPVELSSDPIAHNTGGAYLACRVLRKFGGQVCVAA